MTPHRRVDKPDEEDAVRAMLSQATGRSVLAGVFWIATRKLRRRRADDNLSVLVLFGVAMGMAWITFEVLLTRRQSGGDSPIRLQPVSGAAAFVIAADAVSEEIVFRSPINAVSPNWRGLAVAGSSALFGSIHAEARLRTGLAGFALATATASLGSVVPATVAHIIHNIAVLAVSPSEGATPQ